MGRSHYRTAKKRDLTDRQRALLALLAAGKTNREIGEALGMTLDGAKFHVSEIIAKLNVSSREEAAEWWQAHHGIGRIGSGFLRALFTQQALKWSAALVGAGGAIVAAWLVLGGNDAPEEQPEYEGWVQGAETASGLALRGAGGPMGIDHAVRARHIVLGTVESIGEGRRGGEPFWVYRVATVGVDEVVAARGEPPGNRVQVLIPGGTVKGVDTVMFNQGSLLGRGDRLLLYLDPANFEWLDPGMWMARLDQRIYSTPLNAATPQSLPLETVIQAIRDRRD